jgi:hypothetical protein
MPTGSPLLSVLKWKTVKRGSICFALVFGILILHTAVWAADTFSVRGPSASSGFSRTEGCITTEVFVFATEVKFHDPPGPPTPVSFADVGLFQFDDCTRTTLQEAFGDATLTDEAFQVSRKLTSATLKATVQVTDEISGSTSTLDIDLTWTGTGELVRETDRFHSHAPGVNFQSRFNGRFRDAEASGSVSLGGMNLAQQPSEFARIGSVKEGEVTIE